MSTVSRMRLSSNVVDLFELQKQNRIWIDATMFYICQVWFTREFLCGTFCVVAAMYLSSNVASAWCLIAHRNKSITKIYAFLKIDSHKNSRQENY